MNRSITGNQAGWILALLLGVSFLLLSACDNRSSTKAVTIGQTVTDGNLTITLESLEMRPNETVVVFSYQHSTGPGQHSSAGHTHEVGHTHEYAEMITVTSLELPDRTRLNGYNIHLIGPTGSETILFPPLPDKSVAPLVVNLSSYMVFPDPPLLAEVDIALPAGWQQSIAPPTTEDVGLLGYSPLGILPLDQTFYLDQAQFRLIGLTITTISSSDNDTPVEEFGLAYEPVGDIATRTVIGGADVRTTKVNLADDQGRAYFNTGLLSRWVGDRDVSGQNGQTISFAGPLHPDIQRLTLQIEGIAQIRGPYIFQVELP